MNLGFKEVNQMEFGTINNKKLIEEVNKAILTILNGGQSYKIGSRQLTRADLATLQKMKQSLESQEKVSHGDLFEDTVVAVFEGR